MNEKKQIPEIDIFISYAGYDKESFVLPFLEIAKSKGLACWFDPEQIYWSQNFIDKIKQGIQTSRFFVPFLSRKYMESSNCRFEYDYTRSIGTINILPIIVEDDSIQSHYPELFQEHTRKFIVTKNNYHQLYLSCVFEIKRLYKRLFFLVEDGPEFDNKLRDNVIEALRFTDQVHDFFDYFRSVLPEFIKSNQLNDYLKGFDKFRQDPYSRWLVTVLPEDREIFTEEKMHEIIQEFEKEDKYLIFVESGKNFVEKAVELGGAIPHVFHISTDHDTAPLELVRHMEDEQFTYQKNIHIVLITGPKRSYAARTRMSVYRKFLMRFLEEYGFSGRVYSFRITQLSLNSWKRQTTQDYIRPLINKLDIQDRNTHTCFICANDDIALGVMDLIQEKYGNLDFHKNNISLYGFDGIEEFKKLIKNGIPGATMEVSFDAMAKEILEIVRQSNTKGL
jgi:hypothetical protein